MILGGLESVTKVPRLVRSSLYCESEIGCRYLIFRNLHLGSVDSNRTSLDTSIVFYLLSG